VTTAWPWFPAIIRGLLDHPTFDPSRLDRLRSMLLIGPPALLERVHDVFPSVEIMQACGMTETAGIYALSHPSESRAKRRRRASPCPEWRRIYRPRRPAPTWRPGRRARSLCAATASWTATTATPRTAAALDHDRWLHTGDLYTQTPDGSLGSVGAFGTYPTDVYFAPVRLLRS
jgi:fatty-acyl-CoA synthase